LIENKKSALGRRAILLAGTVLLSFFVKTIKTGVCRLLSLREGLDEEQRRLK